MSLTKFVLNFTRCVATSTPIKLEYIDKLVKGYKLVVFMKGTPTNPMCGFSKAVMDILNVHKINDFESHNVLENKKLRKDIKEYSDWPTIPQVYINGDMVGGCEIFMQMHESGEIIKEFEKAGLESGLELKK
ncbi:Monothiol glutaredoxin-5 [Intoshia linei]|uniref:Glutaredoxin-related protein 5, mitochondrial n=1 Tax=Intoshia linei TaxID=1819745 RepID=A0A177B9B3_9BILA|nr:Monothiol glutaredoxin-5 [Intoshia linei]